jgi:hypothetical protein
MLKTINAKITGENTDINSINFHGFDNDNALGVNLSI